MSQIRRTPALSSVSLALGLAGAFLAEAPATTTRPLLPLSVPSPASQLAPPADPDHFMFAIAGDNRAAGRNLPMPPTARQIFSEYRLLRPAFSLWSGDAIYGADDTVDEARAEWDSLRADADRSATPIFNAPGNHEINDRKELETVYQERAGLLYGSFDYGHSHFIAIDTEEAGRPPGSLSPQQREWLEADLAANVHATHKFVFMHHPLFPKILKPSTGWADPKERDAVHQMFVKYGVKYVFAGHEHLFYRTEHEGITYIVTGGAGAPSEPTADQGGFQHYVLASVNGGEVAFTVLAPWRLFCETGPVLPNGSCTARIDNYQAGDFTVIAELPTDALGSRAVPSASFTYKGKTVPLSAELVPTRTLGTTAVRVTVPRGKSVLVTIAPPAK